MILHIIRNPLYVGKIRWRETIYDGTHPGIISNVLFEKAEKIMKKRVADLSGRRFHNRDERLLAGIIKCARCKSHMVGCSTRKKDRKYPYYICSKRMNTKDCDQDYVRADLLESSILQDVKGMFRDEQFMARVWEEANRCLAAEKPGLETEIEKVEAQIAKTRATIDRYFAAFEAGTMKPQVCTQKVEDLNARVAELEAEKEDLEARRKRLELPAIDRQMLSGFIDDFEKVVAEGTNPQIKDLLHRLVKKVLIHDRQTIEIWYALPNQTAVRTPAHTAPQMCRSTNPSYAPEPEVWFRIRHVAVGGRRTPPVARFRDQTVEIALGSRKVFETANIGTLTRRMAAKQVVASAPVHRAPPNACRMHKHPESIDSLESRHLGHHPQKQPCIPPLSNYQDAPLALGLSGTQP